MALRSISAKVRQTTFRNAFGASNSRAVSDITTLEVKDVETHTGQKWDENDYRMCRFLGKEKQINPNWGIKLIADVPPIPIKGRVTCCDGGSGPTGHPKVYINLDKPGCHSCLYCGLRFYKDECTY